MTGTDFLTAYHFSAHARRSCADSFARNGMKDRATILCIRKDKILLVARARSRWSLPGGTIKRAESPQQAARRELEEETTLEATDLAYLFQFGGFSKRHHVFVSHPGEDALPEPRNEILQCRWFSVAKIATLSTSVPTRGIVELFLRGRARQEGDSMMSDNVGSSV